MAITVNGPVPDDRLGIVAAHEHLLYGLPGWHDDPAVLFDRPRVFDALLAALREFKAAGGNSLMDASGTLCGRDPEFLKALSAAAGINIIASCGLGAQELIPGYFGLPLAERALREQRRDGEPPLWIPDAGYIGGMLGAEMSDGMPMAGMVRSRACAGFVLCACSAQPASEIEEMAIRGAAMAARRHDVPLRLEGGAHAPRLFPLITAEGLAAGRVVIGHCDDARCLDSARDRELASQGAYVAYDHVGWQDGSPHAMPDAQRVQQVKDMVAAGYAERVLLSCGTVGCGLGVPASKHGVSHLLKDFVPRLSGAGVGDSALHTLLVENPRRLFAQL